MNPTLAIDIGGTKTLAALVVGDKVADCATAPTSREGGPDQWIRQAVEIAEVWRGQYALCGVTVTGSVVDGRWSAINPATLDIPREYPIARKFSERFDVPCIFSNDAQAAAWGEYLFGSGNGVDTVFLTVSTGIGGGAVINGQGLHGASGIGAHFGSMLTESNESIEDVASGRWISAEAMRRGYPVSTPAVFEAASNGAQWADALINCSADHIARLCYNLQLVFDPGVIVIGGGVGLANGYLERVRKIVQGLPARVKSNLACAALGANAGVLGVAALANLHSTKGD